MVSIKDLHLWRSFNENGCPEEMGKGFGNSYNFVYSEKENLFLKNERIGLFEIS